MSVSFDGRACFLQTEAVPRTAAVGVHTGQPAIRITVRHSVEQFEAAHDDAIRALAALDRDIGQRA